MKSQRIHLIFICFYFALAVITLIPREAAGKACIFGYKAWCSFSPFSTGVFLVLLGVHVYSFIKNKK